MSRPWPTVPREKPAPSGVLGAGKKTRVEAGGDRRTAVRVTDDHVGSCQVVSTYVLGTLQPT